MDILLVGLNHKTAPVEVRERLAVSQDTVSRILPELLDRLSAPEGLLLSTCNRTEVLLARRPDPEAPLEARDVMAALCELCEAEETPAPDAVYEYRGEDAVRHLLEVASGDRMSVV